MTDSERLPDIDEARQAADESQRRAEADLRSARERARKSHRIAGVLRRLREDNGFGPILRDAYGGGRD